MKLKSLAAVLCLLALAGCAVGNRYQLSKDDAGRLVRLDTQTGEVMLIEDGKLTPAKGTAASVIQSGAQDDALPQVELPADGKSWPGLTLPELGNTRAELTSYWYNGKLHYILELHPLSKRLKLVYSGYYSNPSFSLIVNDKAGKRVAWTAVTPNQLKHTYSKTRNGEQLSAEGVILMSQQDYDSIAAWQLQWNP